MKGFVQHGAVGVGVGCGQCVHTGTLALCRPSHMTEVRGWC